MQSILVLMTTAERCVYSNML